MKMELLAVLENAVRLAVDGGASETEVKDSVSYALRTPERTFVRPGDPGWMPFTEPLDDPPTTEGAP